VTNGRAETLRILANAFDELEQLRCRLRDDSEHVMHAMDAARADERAAVVAWLRAECGSPGHEDRFCAYCNVRRNIAADIERGEHRREDEP
jgi:hypothetical protein